MSELPDEISHEILRIFLDTRNTRTGTGYSLDHLLTTSDDASCDYHFVHPSFGELKVQLTTPAGEADLQKTGARNGYFFEKLEAGIKKSQVRMDDILLTSHTRMCQDMCGGDESGY